ncbi:chemotaxis protein CheA [Methylomicrobium album]|uniref:Chemotaxis protein CheA n=1 Tax=Methylomicrobium album BG8 TaxID=686340 RepID=H8GMW8_METAL|nr:chemotaxis protein CheA [Methylomicrobium album]EIC29520.1 chemotaxis protein histidine kinase-like protein [Methylomicrobium album BG8]
MSIDMSQFHQVFFEECFEGLDAMESGLLNLDTGDIDAEMINTIFRGAHSIKGGSGTFGFHDVADFTHVMETLLDEMRDGRRKVTQPAVDVLLGSVDCLRTMLTSIQEGESVDRVAVEKYKLALEIQLNGAAGGAPATEPPSSRPESGNADDEAVASEACEMPEQGWKIAFCPYLDLLKTGNDPVRIFRELAELGDYSVSVNTRDVPGLFELDPEDCNLSWTLQIKGDISFQEVNEVFSWVEGDCELDIQPLTKPGKTVPPVKKIEPEPVPPETGAPKTELGEAEAKTGTGNPESTKQSVSQPDNDQTKSPKSSNSNSSSIRVDTAKIDALIDLVGEVVITQSMLGLISENFTMDQLEQLKRGLSQLERHTRDMQQSVMNIRMLPISFVFSRFPRLVHDIGAKLGKKIELKLVGENTEVDKAVVELINDPLVHLIRNSLDHGIEMPVDRLVAGKSEIGTIELNAYHRGGHIVIEISDDGRGLDRNKLIAKAVEKGLIAENSQLSDKQAFELIFMPGFSTAESITDISGRGVGMDVVRKNIQALGGNVDIISELGKGTTISIHLPLTLAIIDGQSVAVGDEIYIVPLVSIIESINVTEKMLNTIAGKGEAFKLRNQYIPIIRMHEVFNVPLKDKSKPSEGVIVVVERQGALCGLFVDELLGPQQVVVKSLEANYRRVEGISGATILGDGSVALILDVPGLVRYSNRQAQIPSAA